MWDTYERKKNAGKVTRTGILESDSDGPYKIEEHWQHNQMISPTIQASLPLPQLSKSVHDKHDWETLRNEDLQRKQASNSMWKR